MNCCEEFIGKADKKISIQKMCGEMFFATRGETIEKPITEKTINFNNLNCYPGDRRTFEQHRTTFEESMPTKGWIILVIHKIQKDGTGLFIDTDEHAKLINYLAANKDRIWTAPVIEIAGYLKTQVPSNKLSIVSPTLELSTP